MGWLRRTATRAKKKRGYASESRSVDDAVTTHLTQFAQSRRGVEAFVEPKTAVTETTLLLVAFDGAQFSVRSALDMSELQARAAGSCAAFCLKYTSKDDIPSASLVWPGLTTVRQEMGKIGETACQLVRRALERKTPGGGVHEFPSSLVVRESTGRVPTGE